nr:hypothetical protein [Tanacetum cinerariifolium]GFA95291.1 hypothetical protein [Tanacetum cinerariifolium]
GRIVQGCCLVAAEGSGGGVGFASGFGGRKPIVPGFLWGIWMEVVGSMWSDEERQESRGDAIVDSGGKIETPPVVDV